MNTIAELKEYLMRGETTAQDARYHPEGNVLTHSLLAFANALHRTHDIDIITAALFHDIGKVGRDFHTEHRHARESEILVRGVLNEKQTWLIKEHMRIGHYVRGEMKNPTKRLELELSTWFKDLLLLHTCDRDARTPQSAAQIYALRSILEAWFGRVYDAAQTQNVR